MEIGLTLDGRQGSAECVAPFRPLNSRIEIDHGLSRFQLSRWVPFLEN